jgi:hypothetical protein
MCDIDRTRTSRACPGPSDRKKADVTCLIGRAPEH